MKPNPAAAAVFFPRHPSTPYLATSLGPGASAAKRVLIVDDEPDVAESIALLIELMGHADGWKVVTAESGEMALKLLDGGSFGLVVADYHLGSVDGLEVLACARRRMPGVPCILISADGVPPQRLDPMFESTVTFIPKPFSPALFLGLVDQIFLASAPSTRPRELTPDPR